METSNEIPILPLDVIETIIAVLATVDDQYLYSVKTCSLTCKSFLHLCRRHIFASISLDMRGAKSPFRTTPKFQKLPVGTAPEIVHFVRTLSVGVAGDKSVAETESQELVDLAELLKMFPRIEHLTIASYRRGDVQDWANVAACMQAAVLHLLMLPTLDDLRLSELSHFPLLALARCAHLRGLCTETLMDPVYDTRLPTAHPRSLVLEEYDLACGSSQAMKKLMAFQWPDGPPFLDFSHLLRFSVRNDITDQQATKLAPEILQRTDRIDRILLEIISAMKPSALFDTVRHSLKSLRRIHVYCYIGYSSDILIELSNQLRHIQELPNVLEEVMVWICPPVTYNFDVIDNSAWGVLDAAFQGSGWSSLRRVAISIQISQLITQVQRIEQGTGYDSAIRNVPQTQFPFLFSSKAITFTFDTPFLAYGSASSFAYTYP